MLTLAITLAVFSFLIEVYIAINVEIWRRLAPHRAIFGLIISMALSVAVGTIFGAGGLIVMLAGMMSTAMSMVFYPCLKWYDAGGSNTINNFFVSARRAAAAIMKFIDRVQKAYESLVRTLTWPSRTVNNLKARFSRA